MSRSPTPLPFSVFEVSESTSSAVKFEMLSATSLSSYLSEGDFYEVASSVDGSDTSAAGSAISEGASEFSEGCCRLQYMMLAVTVRFIFWFTCHSRKKHSLNKNLIRKICPKPLQSQRQKKGWEHELINKPNIRFHQIILAI